MNVVCADCLSRRQFLPLKKMFLLAALITTLVFTSHISAQDKVSGVKENAEARAELKTLLSKLNTFSSGFEQRIEDAQGQILQVSNGMMKLRKPNQLRWEVRSPDESLFIADGATVYNLDPFVEQVTLLDQSSIVGNNPLMLLISNDDEAWDQVSINRVESIDEVEQSSFMIKSLAPDANIVTLALSFHAGKLMRLVSEDRQQQINHIVFSDVRQNLALNDDDFSIDIPNSYFVDDQRQNAQ
ncbi:outer membrane lipoprotein chaperone LolA [Ningiella sp. W23]|uniref:outer membrane lipoprotein chaperone LolA n=1 Tax=Ningiella sp. W23 TaxID=3023715 RepID=UPI00375736FE